MSTSTGPLIRVGVLQNEESLQFTLLGNFKLPEGVNNYSKGNWKAVVKEATPARMQYTLIHKKCTSTDDAQIFIDKNKKNCQRWITVGENIQLTGGTLQGEEYWVAGKSFTTIEEAEKHKKTFFQAEYIDILCEILTPATGTILLRSPEGEEYSFKDSIYIQNTQEKNNRIVLQEVLVGIGFHWEHRENQRYRGSFEIKIDNKGFLTAINILPLEEYLFSVNSSEMKADCPMELLKAQTVAARNTVLATRKKHHYADGFDVCADDHCQCYRGSTRENDTSLEAVRQTCGEILVYKDIICDTRYSKICGGISEDFHSTWFSDPIPYMIATPDISSANRKETASLFPADSEQAAYDLIESDSPFFCNVNGQNIPSTIEYAREYYRWEFCYEAEELGHLIETKTGHQVGTVQQLIPLSRGRSGRIEWLKILGSGMSVTIGKELQIRFALHEKCLYSSCFVVDTITKQNKRYFILKGAGWGHGVGMCQIGATVMAHQGYTHKEILAHYFPPTKMKTLYPALTENEIREYYQKQEREGERCYEFFNCYEVHHCPIYLNKKGEKCWEAAQGLESSQIPPNISKKMNCNNCQFKNLHEEEKDS